MKRFEILILLKGITFFLNHKPWI